MALPRLMTARLEQSAPPEMKHQCYQARAARCTSHHTAGTNPPNESVTSKEAADQLVFGGKEPYRAHVSRRSDHLDYSDLLKQNHFTYVLN